VARGLARARDAFRPARYFTPIARSSQTGQVPRATGGAAAGLLAGAAGALIYALHCPEMDAPFLAIWYLPGMLIPTAAGTLLGPRLLRW